MSPESKKAKRSSLKQVVSQFQREVDDLLIHQCLVRRFRQQCPQGLVLLTSLRDGLSELLEPGAGGWNCMIESYDEWNDQAVLDLLHALSKRSCRNALREARAGNMRPLQEHADFKVLQTLSKASRKDALEFMISQLSDIELLVRDWNFFDYYGLLSMTLHADMQILLDLYALGYTRARARSPVNDSFPPPLPADLQWRRYRNDKLPPNVRHLLASGVSSPHFASATVEIFDDSANTVTVNGRRTSDSLYLRLDLNQAPIQIDRALVYLRNALKNAAIAKHNMWANYARNDDLDDSNFMTTLDSRRYFSQPILRTLLAIHCWDRVHEGDETIEAAAAAISRACDQTWKENKLTAARYEPTTIQKDYARIAKAIRGPSCKAAYANTLDELITASPGIVIGRRT